MQLTRGSLVRMLLFCLTITQSWCTSQSATTITKPGCQSQCGNVRIPYPFGIGPGCFLSDWFEMTCNTTFNPPKPFIGGLSVLDISISDTTFRVANKVARQCYDESGNLTYDEAISTSLGSTSPFTFSQKNQFTLIGCDDFALFVGYLQTNFTGACLALCTRPEEVVNGSCNGVGCCQTSFSKGLKYYSTSVGSMVSNHTGVWSFDPCSYSFMSEKGRFTFHGVSDLMDPDFSSRTKASVPILVDWVVGNLKCSEAKNTGVLACQANTHCVDSDTGAPGYRCICNKGYQGHPYLHPGCQDIKCNEARNAGVLACKANSYCTDSDAGAPGYTCTCNQGYQGQPDLDPGCQDINECEDPNTNLCKGICINTPGSYSCSCADGYISNGRGWIAENSEEFPVIKFSLVVILTQLNHRNVVKLLGCCLESEVPLLVYEYVSNGTLADHIHDKGTLTWLSWENRLRVAAESAGALSYLHSATSTPVIHRDVKSANILLDEKYTTKIADFGASRLVPMDQTQVTTLVQGTLGYLDPEYFQTSQLTEKSDVYSFGVVLAELLTGKKPLCMDRSEEERNLATHFIVSLKENRLFQILEPRVVREGTLDQLQEISELVKRCVNLTSDERPTMKEVAIQLEGLRKFTQHPWASRHGDEENTSLLVTENKETDLH